MTDRELLELAAKACGYWSNEYKCVDKLPHLGWNPLTDDGDALRLAVKLRIRVNTDICFAEVPYEKQCAATRRAIVSAAAAIGKEST